MGNPSVFARCNHAVTNPLNCNGNWIIIDGIVPSVAINICSCPWASCGSFRTHNSLNSVACAPNGGYTLDWKGKNSYKNEFSSYYLIWNKILQQWICQIGNNLGCGASTDIGYQSQPGWPVGLTTGNTAVIDWNRDGSTLTQMSMECIGMYFIKWIN